MLFAGLAGEVRGIGGAGLRAQDLRRLREVRSAPLRGRARTSPSGERPRRPQTGTPEKENTSFLEQSGMIDY